MAEKTLFSNPGSPNMKRYFKKTVPYIDDKFTNDCDDDRHSKVEAVESIF
jgi:hypothetical protein